MMRNQNIKDVFFNIRKIIAIVFFIVMIGILFGPSVTNNIRERIEKKEAVTYDMNHTYRSYLGISGRYYIKYDKVKLVDNYKVDIATACANIYYYNMYHDEKISLDTLKKEYNKFCKGRGKKSYKQLDNFVNFIKESQIYMPSYADGELKIPYIDYILMCLENPWYVHETELEEQDAFELCDKMMQNKMDIYLYFLGRRMNNTWDTAVHDKENECYIIFQSNVESVVDDFSGESDIIELDGGEIILHVRKCDVMKLEYMITQIEVSGSDKQVLGCGLGDDYNNIISKLDNIINGPEDVNMCYEKSNNKIDFSIDDIVHFVYEFNDEGICTKIVYGVLD